jgi:glutaredoxin-like protein NrdH
MVEQINNIPTPILRNIMEVSVFSLPDCMQCDATVITLESLSVPYETTKLDQDPEAKNLIKTLGFMQAPVVIVYNKGEVVSSWSGFRPDRLEELKKYFI